MTDLPLAKHLAESDVETLREMLREAELHLASQQTVALAADQRAITLSGFLAAAVIVLVGAATSFAGGKHPENGLAVICILVAVTFVYAIWLAIQSAAPSDFDFAGSSPSDWIDDVGAGVALQRSLAEQCANYAESIDDNCERMKWNGETLWMAITTARKGIVLGGIAFVIALILR